MPISVEGWTQTSRPHLDIPHAACALELNTKRLELFLENLCRACHITAVPKDPRSISPVSGLVRLSTSHSGLSVACLDHPLAFE